METGGPVLLYDDGCGLCSRVVRFVLHHDRSGPLRFAPLQGRYGRGVIEQFPALEGVDSVVWFEPGDGPEPPRVATRSAAALCLARYLGGAWSLLLVFWIVPRPLRDRIYDMVAKHRHRLAGENIDCPSPSEYSRHRFID